MEKEHKNKTHAHLSGIVSQLNEFHTISSQTLTTNNSHSIVPGIHLNLPKGIGNNMIFLFEKCDTFDRTAKGRTWLVGVTTQDHPDYK